MESEKFVIRHDGENFDVTTFLRYHPGGSNTIGAYNGRDITEKLKQVKHAPSALYLLQEYKVNKQKEQDIELLVDWSKPILPQVGKLGERYTEWISCPVDRKLRLFKSDLAESLSVTPWYLIPIVWIPTALYFFLSGLRYNQMYISDLKFPFYIAGSFVFGMLMWSLLEYSLHRWVFHLKPPATSSRLITFHFLMHGLHHKVPFDDRRLLFPPVPAGMIIAIIYFLYTLIFPNWAVDVISAGSLTGYIIYDLMHFYLHYGSPKPDSYFYEMKRYHNQHHFTHHENGFGISSKLWDQVFGTEIFLRKLKWSLKW